MALNLARERAIAISAVLKACHLSSTVYQKLVKQETVTKDDKSPVTVADYTAQALISALLSHHFPSYPLIGEESSSDLFNKVEKKPLRDKIMDLANWALTERKLEVEEDEKVWEPLAKHGKREEEFWLEALDRGGHESAAKGSEFAISSSSVPFRYFRLLTLFAGHRRSMGTGSDRRDERVPSRRSIRSLPRPHSGWRGRIGRHGYSQSTGGL